MILDDAGRPEMGQPGGSPLDVQQTTHRQPALPAGSLLQLQQVDQLHRGAEPYPQAVLLSGGHAQRGGQMRLAGPGATNSTTFCAASVKAKVASCRTRDSSTFAWLKSKSASVRCTGKRAAVVW